MSKEESKGNMPIVVHDQAMVIYTDGLFVASNGQMVSLQVWQDCPVLEVNEESGQLEVTAINRIFVADIRISVTSVPGVVAALTNLAAHAKAIQEQKPVEGYQ